jgi:methyl-accepting chemotaxis protein
MPQVQELIKQIFYEEISSVSSRVIIDILIATGNKALVDAILAKSLTRQQAEMLKQVSKDPQVEAALEQVKGRILEGIEASVASVQDAVLPEVTEATVQLAKGAFASLKDAVDDIPGVGAAMAVVDAAFTGIGALENAVDLTEKVNTAIAPVKEAIGQIGTLTDAVNTAANDASGAASGLSDQASGAAASTVSNVTSSVSGLSDADQESADPKKSHPPSITMNAPPQIQRQPAAAAAAAAGGGSRTRRRIHKLSRRIERTLRRVQKKYGLQDKNSFLRRTLKRK